MADGASAVWVAATPAQKPRWVDLVDSSQEDLSQALQPSLPSPPGASQQDSYESQGCSQGLSDMLLGAALSPEKFSKEESMMSAEAEHLPAKLRSKEQQAASGSSGLSRARSLDEPEVVQLLEQIQEVEEAPSSSRTPLSSVLEAAASASVASGLASSPRRKRRGPAPPVQVGSAQASPSQDSSRKRRKARGAGRARLVSSSEAQESFASFQELTAKSSAQSSQRPAQAAPEESQEKTLQKRRMVVMTRKEGADYQAFAARRPRALRRPDEPMTPDPEELTSKRQWETQVQRWREKIRTWYKSNGGMLVGEEDDAVESPDE
eukprot:TRINITY_DN18993_c0_g1_i1.p1 TRINITY_DN18993_c0_g1~~TRINITY_DN18993_c0_g1_i1.p1  ORF type:complete len:330 (+),score=83.99 TRINITY_DN18993_c0_g1_i1:29-991(+)